MRIVKAYNCTWYCKQVTPFKFAQVSTEDGGLYAPLTQNQTTIDSEDFPIMFQGQRDTLFAIDIDVNYQPSFWLGQLHEEQETMEFPDAL